MSKFEFCLPTSGKSVPAGPEWFHEIKYDGFRIRLERDEDRVRLITRGGYDWTKRYPWIVEAALKNRKRQFVIDGEAVILGADGISDFNALHCGMTLKIRAGQLTTNVMNYAVNKPSLHSLGMADVVAAYLKEACH
jgi:ATP-dependent DNA ligase